jgi:zinc protease
MKRWKTIFVVLFIVTTASSSVVAQPLRVMEKVLPNGLTVLLKEDHKAPVVTFQVWYKVGSRNEQLGKTGISHMLEHMMFKGTKKYGPKTFSRTVQRSGGNDNAFTSHDYTAYFENFASDRLELSLELESDRMQNLLIDTKEFLSERDVVKEERRMRTEDDPANAMSEQMMSVAFSAHPYQWPVIGWMTDISSLTRDDLVRHYRTYYAPNNATIVVAGDFDAKKLLPMIEKYFASIPRGPEVPVVTAVEPRHSGERRVIVRRKAELSVVYSGYNVPTIRHPDSYPLEVLQTVISSGKSSRLYRSLVYEKQLALFAGGDYDNISADPNLFTLYAGVMPGKSAEDVEQALYAEIEKMKHEPVTDEELQKAKNQIEAGFIMGQDSVFYQAMLLGQLATVADWKLLGTYVEHVRAVTREDVMRVAREYFSPDNRTVGILVPIRE